MPVATPLTTHDDHHRRDRTEKRAGRGPDQLARTEADGIERPIGPTQTSRDRGGTAGGSRETQEDGPREPSNVPVHEARKRGHPQRVGDLPHVRRDAAEETRRTPAREGGEDQDDTAANPQPRSTAQAGASALTTPTAAGPEGDRSGP